MTQHLRIVLLALLLGLSARVGRAQPVSQLGELYPTDGKRRQARVVRIADDWQVELEDADGTRFSLPVDRIARWGRQQEPTGPYAVLIDGGWAAGDVIAWTKSDLTIGIDYENFSQRSVWEPSKIPLDVVRGVVLQPAARLESRDQIRQWLSDTTARSDRIRMINDDQLLGSIRGLEEAKTPNDQAVGLVPSDDQRLLKIKVAGRDAEVAVPLVRAVAMNPALFDLAPLRASGATVVRLAFRDGSSVDARKLDSSGEYVLVTAISGAVLKTTHTRFIRQLCSVQPRNSTRFVYLSDIQPLGYRHIPFLTIAWPKPGIDANLHGGVLRSPQGWALKGLGMHSTSRLAFDLEGKYDRFEAELAIDGRVRSAGSVRFRVYLDSGDGKFAAAFASPTIRGGQPPLPISVPLNGAQRMALIVDFADRGDAGDHANWLNARLLIRP